MLHDRIVPQVSQDVKDALERINAVGERNRREYEALARMTGLTIAEVEADLTAPDPGLEEGENGATRTSSATASASTASKRSRTWPGTTTPTRSRRRTPSVWGGDEPMKMSDSIKNLAAALAAAQAEMPAAELNAVNPFLNNKFADLGSIISTSRPVLARHDLSVSQLPVTVDGNIGVTTLLMHSSGEWIESTIVLPIAVEKGKSMAQVAGSIITYLRRYSLAAILSMYADEDADGEAPSKSTKKSPSSKTGVKSHPTQRNGKPSRWQNFLTDNEIAEEDALKALGQPSVDAWMRANPGKSERDAHAEILQNLGK